MRQIHLVCSNCTATNRVDQARIGQGPVCGKCKNPLIPNQPVELNPASWDKFLRAC